MLGELKMVYIKMLFININRSLNNKRSTNNRYKSKPLLLSNFIMKK